MAHLTKRTRKRNVKGRKPPQFAQMVLTILKDSTVTLEEMMDSSPTKTLDEESGRVKATYDTMPEDCTVIQSLNGNWAFKDSRLFRHLDMLAKASLEFGDEFRAPEGASLMDLRLDRKKRTWGDEIAVCGLAYLLIGAGLAEWTSSRDEWSSYPDKMPRLKFITKEEEHYEQPKTSSEETRTHTP